MRKFNTTSELFKLEMLKPGLKAKAINVKQGSSNTNGREVVFIEKVGNSEESTWLISDPYNDRTIKVTFTSDYRTNSEFILYLDELNWKEQVVELENKLSCLNIQLIEQNKRIADVTEEIKMHKDFESQEEYLASKLLDMLNGTKDLKSIAEIIKQMKSTNLL